MLNLHDFQKRAIEFAWRRRRAYIMMDTGLGKTAVALNVIARSNNPTIVLAPLSVCYNVWPDEIEKWTPEQNYTIVHGPDKDIRAGLKRDVYIMNYETLKWFFIQLVNKRYKFWNMNLVCDEATFLKSWTTTRHTLMEKLKPIFGNRKLMLSATPTPNGYRDLWAPFYHMDGGNCLGNNAYAYQGRYFKQFRKYKWVLNKGAKQEIQKRIYPSSFRLDKRDYLKLPPITYNKVKVKLDAKNRELYERLEREFVLDIAGRSTITAVSAAALGSKLRQFIGGAIYSGKGKNRRTEFFNRIKAERLRDIIAAHPNEKIIVPFQFRFEPDIIRKTCKHNYPAIFGETSANSDRDTIKRWNAGALPVLLVHPESIAWGNNLQHGGRMIVWYSLPWVLDHYTQLRDRLYRQGQTRRVIMHHIMVENSLDYRVLDILMQKNASQQALLDALRR